MDIIDIENQVKAICKNTVIFHPDFWNDFFELVERSHKKQKIIDLFFKKLSMIVDLGNIDYGTDWIEHLKDCDNMYSLHIKTRGVNFRILFSRTRTGKLFLRMFDEKSGKRATSYNKNRQIALSRKCNFDLEV